MSNISDAQRDGSKHILDSLKANGDNPETVRTVFHYCYFKKRKLLKEFKKHLTEQNIIFRPTVKGSGVVIMLPSSMKEDEIFSQIETIAHMVLQADGEYDGWETTLEK